MKIENIKACVFDAYGTLFDVNSAAAKCKEKLGSKWEGFANAWRTTQLEYTWLRSLMKKHKNFWEITEDSLDHSMETFKIKKEMRNELLDLYKKLRHPSNDNELSSHGHFHLSKKNHAGEVLELLPPGSFAKFANQPNDLPPFQVIDCKGGRCRVRQQAWGRYVHWEVEHNRLKSA